MKGFSMKEYLKEIDSVICRGPYQDTWDSLSTIQIPGWFAQAKFGIFIHWGLYSLAAHENEWYSRNMYIQEKEEWDYHRKTFGPHTEFGYKDFIPLFQAEKFDPYEWAQLFAQAGAKYIMSVAEHHDGFQMYDSAVSQWNTVRMGPHRDILGELKAACKKEGLRFCTSSHRAEHWFFMSHGREFDSDIKEPLVRGDFYWPAMPEPEHQDLQSMPYPSEEFLQDWLVRTCELAKKYEPQLLYFDWWIEHEAFKPYLKKAAAYYYNLSADKGMCTAICYKHDAMMWGSGIAEIERGSFRDAKPYVWQTDTAIANNSWCYTDTLDYKDAGEIIRMLVDIVSKNGNLLLNIGPKGDGSIPDTDKKILGQIGAWLKIHGEAIYGSHVWRVSGEGPTETAEGQFTDLCAPKYQENDFRFTAKGGCIYVFAMQYPEHGQITVRSLAKSEDQNQPKFHGLVEDVAVLGNERPPEWSVDQIGLHVKMQIPDRRFPVALRVRVK